MELYPGEFTSIDATQDGRVATIRIMGSGGVDPVRPVDKSHWELAELLTRLRGRDDIRVLILTGYAEGIFLRPPPSDTYAAESSSATRNDPKGIWRSFTSVIRILEGILAIEKPVVAKVNGDAIGFGQSVMWACDLIVAREDARVIDHHLGNKELGRGSPYDLVPGDGGTGLVPSYFSPARAKEYLMLGREQTGAELAQLGLINYAVPANRLDSLTDELVARLLERSAYALAWTKRAANKGLIQDFNLRHDLSNAYEMVSKYQSEWIGWNNASALD